MSYILSNSELHTSIQKETLPAVSNEDLDMHHLANSCPLLRSVYYEVLQLRKRDLAFQKVEYNTELGNKCLHGGNFTIIPICQLHDNEDVFSFNALTFDPERFLKQQH